MTVKPDEGPLGISWQIAPEAFVDLMRSKHESAGARAFAAVMQMTRPEIDYIQAVYDGTTK